MSSSGKHHHRDHLHHQQKNQQQSKTEEVELGLENTDNPDSPDDPDDPDGPTTPRASAILFVPLSELASTPQRDSSGSSTEREGSRRRSKRIKGKGPATDEQQRQLQRQHRLPEKEEDDLLSYIALGKDTSTMGESQSSSSSSRRYGSSSKSKGKTPKVDDWSEVIDPEERRRIQNRIAQRRFREKAREQKEQAARDLQNQVHAGSTYQVPDPADLQAGDEDLSGVPWGGPSMRFMMARGHAASSLSGDRPPSYASPKSNSLGYYSDDAATAVYLGDMSGSANGSSSSTGTGATSSPSSFVMGMFPVTAAEPATVSSLIDGRNDTPIYYYGDDSISQNGDFTHSLSDELLFDDDGAFFDDLAS